MCITTKTVNFLSLMPYSINKQSITCYSQVKILRRKKNGEERGTSSLPSRIFIWSSKTYLRFMKSNCHCEKYHNFAWFTGVEILWKGTVLAWFRAIRQKLCESCRTRKSGEITVFFAVYTLGGVRTVCELKNEICNYLKNSLKSLL